VRFAAMGTTAHIVVNGPETLLASARARIEDLEGRWSRFRGDSEVSRLNRHGVARVSAETEDLVVRSIAGWHHTGGRFDPTVHHAMIGLGYDTTFERIAAEAAVSAPVAAPGCGGIEVSAGVVRLPEGAGFDPGGIGKGLAADLVASEMVAGGADGALVNLGGDLRAAGAAESGSWAIEIEEPLAGVREVVAFDGGAVATSTPLRRTWIQGSERRHHLIDPGRGLPVSAPPALVSVVAGEAWWAEVCTKAAMVVPRGLLSGLLDDASALVVGSDGSRVLVNGMERYLR
jgi:FAD:protein FMN transferase